VSLLTAPTRSNRPSTRRLAIPREARETELEVGGKTVRLTNLAKPFWPEDGITKGDLLQYYADISPVLLPHLRAGGARGSLRDASPAPASDKCV
jgi:bifunctional non-homologous end joining protein LigD